MRISDWSSDVCSSDLITAADIATRQGNRHRARSRREWKRNDALPAVRADPRLTALATAWLPIHGVHIIWQSPGTRQGSARSPPEIGRASCRERVCQYV